MARPLDFSVIPIHANADDFVEKRYAYNGSDLEYEGWSKKPNASTDQPVWFIVKYSYTGTDLTRQQLPDDGPKFIYIWDSRNTYFS
jgi:hypothetical protein